MSKIKVVSLFFGLSILTACSSIKPPINNIIAIDSDGEPVMPGSSIVLGKDAYNNHIKNVLTTSNNKIVIYIHGGLNTPRSAINTANKLTPEIEKDGYKAIFIDWRSGFFTTYAEHLFLDRQGENWPYVGPITSPFILLEDLGRGIIRAPMVWWQVAGNYVKSLNLRDTPSEENARKITDLEAKNDYFKETPKLVDNRTLGETLGDNLIGFAQTGFGLVTAPVFDAGGTGAWAMMKRRTGIMFTKSKPAQSNSYNSHEEYLSLRNGAASIFFNALEKQQKENPDLEIILVGHSMGSIVANKIIKNWPELRISKIIYMAAACSIEDFQSSVLPYLENKINKETVFYNFMLHPIAENSEAHGYGIGGTGSLLTQIDNFYEKPTVESERTMGRWVNVMNGINYVTDKHNEVNQRIILRTMPLGSNYPTQHGEFDEPEFIKSGKFWKGELGQVD